MKRIKIYIITTYSKPQALQPLIKLDRSFLVHNLLKSNRDKKGFFFFVVTWLVGYFSSRNFLRNKIKMTLPIISLPSRIRGSLYGVATVDALGGPVEFHSRGTFPPVTSFRHNPNFNLAPGTWTDDTSMTLCLAQSLVDTHGVFVARDQIKKYIAWYDDGYMSATGKCFDIGMATRTALTIWRDFFNNAGSRGGEGKGTKKNKQDKAKENENEGVDDGDAHLAGQVLIDKALKHEVCPRPPPTSILRPPSLAAKQGAFEKRHTPERLLLYG